jgi:hypothetical protein
MTEVAAAHRAAAAALLRGALSPELARNGPPAISAQWSLTGGKRTSRLRPTKSEKDPERTSAECSHRVYPPLSEGSVLAIGCASLVREGS